MPNKKSNFIIRIRYIPNKYREKNWQRTIPGGTHRQPHEIDDKIKTSDDLI